MKKLSLLILATLLSLAVMWSVLSLYQFYADGQSLSYWHYMGSINKVKLIDLAISLLPVVFLLFYYTFKKKVDKTV
jgi:hypothetical protein